MNAFFAPHLAGREMYLGVRGDLVPVGVHAGQRPCPENVTALSGENLTEIRRTHEITWVTPLIKPVPRSLTPRKIRDRLASDRLEADPSRLGEDIDAVVIGLLTSNIPLETNGEPVLAAGTNLPLRDVAIRAWMHSQEYLRNDPLLIQFAAVLGYTTPEALDTFFRKA